MSKKAILHRFLKIKPSDVLTIDDLSGETVSLRRSDYPLHVVFKDGHELIVLIEIQTFFNQDFVLRLIDYEEARHNDTVTNL